mmetsp:Transcript_28721/g.39689  ORF Transcript_28721/g.39689 Transcript_28721/m.39689 type:complete len:425 (+) Transcript_28721:53-1327(+)|eukprot:CAMPEP_0196585612 /NCGR_PEP_ID=MMETSP1081-20130531/51338_1 /TAXON_ID=36882 /ORGANISM="Pyramimonas amylifera, Strain CCMP720" /LENGTH=424 /DNA_ID=CAMNT_0041907221 /DNA_START=32 /DNA_END=1306 /DNA_ORIENTATION=+
MFETDECPTHFGAEREVASRPFMIPRIVTNNNYFEEVESLGKRESLLLSLLSSSSAFQSNSNFAELSAGLDAKDKDSKNTRERTLSIYSSSTFRKKILEHVLITFNQTKEALFTSHLPFLLHDFQLRGSIEESQGSITEVKLVQHLKTGVFYALKMLDKTKVKTSCQVKQAVEEKTILAEVQHRNVIKLHATFDYNNYLLMILEWAPGGKISSMIEESGRFSYKTAQFFAANVVLGLEQLHSQNILHRNLKPSNLLLGRKGYVKIVGFGSAKKICNKTFSMCGTLQYAAPEMIRGVGHDHMVDWWSLGIMLYEFLSGCLPFATEATVGTYWDIVSCEKIFFPYFFNLNIRDLITKLLRTDSTQRLGSENGAQEIKSHPFFADFDWSKLAKGQLKAPISVEIQSKTKFTNLSCFVAKKDDELNGF